MSNSLKKKDLSWY